MILDFTGFLNEDKKLSLSFKVEDDGTTIILGKKFDIIDLLNDYPTMIYYAFATHVKTRLRYNPEERRFRISKDPDKLGQIYDIAINMVKFRSVKVKPELITGLDTEAVLRSTRGAASSRQLTPHYVEILDANDDVIRTYKISPETGELK